MAEALVGGWINQDLVPAGRIRIGEPDSQRCRYWRETYGVDAGGDNRRVLEGADMALLAVKPQVMADVLDELSSVPFAGIWISIAAGIPIGMLAGHLGERGRFLRVMPNTPALVGAGMSAADAQATAPTAKALPIRILFMVAPPG